jgi:signal transduction histidine kinase
MKAEAPRKTISSKGEHPPLSAPTQEQRSQTPLANLHHNATPHTGETSTPLHGTLPPALPASHASATGLACAVLAIAALDILGWLLHLPLLTSILPHYATMKPNTAICLALLALAALLKRRRRPSLQQSERHTLAWLAGSLSAALTLPISVARIIEFATGRDLGIDRFILRIAAGQSSGVAGRMSLGTPVCLVLIAATLLLLDWKPRLSTGCLLAGAGLSFSALIGFLFDAGPLFGAPLFRVLAVPTAISLLLLQGAVFTLRPEREPFLSLTHANRSGRRQWLLLGVTVLPALVALPLLLAMRSGFMDPPVALALLVVVLICIQTLILWQDSKALLQVDGRRKRTEQALLQSEKLAVVGRLAASISHEINNPLEAISNILYLVRNAESLEIAREYALMGEQELSRVAQITTQTLSFYRENRQAAMCPPIGILESALTLLGGKINSSRVQVKVDFHDDVQPIRCRDGEMRQVFVNLISNAVEATPPGGQVVVRMRSSIAWQRNGPVHGVRILIADSGRGIPAELRDRIFEPFFTTKAHETGNGLGLWVVQDLIENQHGAIHMRSRTLRGRQGTTFNIFLPYETSPAEPNYLVGAPAAAVGPA